MMKKKPWTILKICYFLRIQKDSLNHWMEKNLRCKPCPQKNSCQIFGGGYKDANNHDEESAWIPSVDEASVDCPRMEDRPTTEEEFKFKLNKTQNFKSPGSDQGTNFCM